MLSRKLEQTLRRALAEANARGHEYATVEHLLLALTEDEDAVSVMRGCGVNVAKLRKEVIEYVEAELSTLAQGKAEDAKPTAGFQRVLQRAAIHVQSAGREDVTAANVLIALFSERESHAVHFLQTQEMTRFDAVNFVSHGIAKAAFSEPKRTGGPVHASDVPRADSDEVEVGHARRWHCGFSTDRLKRLTAAMQSYVDQGKIAGVVTLVHRHGETAHCDVLGWQDKEAGIPMRRDTLFRIASMTKPIVSVAALMLVEEGKLRLGEPVDRLLPELANRKVLRTPGAALDDVVDAPRPITLKDLLLHRSGIPYPLTAEGPLAAALFDFNKLVLPGDLPMDDWMARMGALPLVYAPGERWHYGFSTDVLGILIARASGVPFPEYLRTRIFEPLGMADTFFWVPDDKLERFGPAYTPDPKTGTLKVQDHPNTSRWRNPASFPSGGAGLISTADDYLKFGKAILGGGRSGAVRLLSRAAFEQMTTDHLTPAERATPFLGMPFWPAMGFGLGLSIADNLPAQDWLGSPGRLGWPGAYGTWWVADPREDMVALMMIQLYFGAGGYLRTDCETAIYQAIDD
jgi:CubicO group peptidase (beta-lactamase class C family)